MGEEYEFQIRPEDFKLTEESLKACLINFSFISIATTECYSVYKNKHYFNVFPYLNMTLMKV